MRPARKCAGCDAVEGTQRIRVPPGSTWGNDGRVVRRHTRLKLTRIPNVFATQPPSGNAGERKHSVYSPLCKKCRKPARS